MLQEIGAGIYQIKMRLPWPIDFMPCSPATLNAYVVVRGDRVMLVDSGLNDAACRQTMREDLARLGLEASSLTDLVITHFHRDHIGLVDELRGASPDARIHVHPADLSLIRERYFRPAHALVQLLSWLTRHGRPAREDADVCAVRLDSGEFTARAACAHWDDERVRVLELDGQTWQLIWTPGHTPGHLVVFSKDEQILLSGDQLLASTTSNVSKHPGSGDNPVRDYRSSLAILTELPAQLWPGHGEPVCDLPGRVDRALHQQDRKLSRVMDAVDGPTVTAYQVSERLWGRGRSDLDAGSRRTAFTETIALMAFLESTGDLGSRVDATGLVTYARGDRDVG